MRRSSAFPHRSSNLARDSLTISRGTCNCLRALRALRILLLHEHLLPEDLLHYPQVVRLAIDDILELLDVLSQLLDLRTVERLGVFRRLFDIEPSADVDQYVGG